MSRKLVLIVASLVLATGLAFAKDLVNTDRKGLNLDGYDPVAFQTFGKAYQGTESLTAAYDGATYRFVSEKNRELFQKDPEKYVPAYGGYCAWAVSQGKLAPVDVSTWQIVDGRLVLNYDASVRAKFDADRDALIKKADANWPGLVEQKGK